jgi:2-polyprenyl-6-methoxyphenol hydroxylase-like FAD-dependent oxidoreductase
MSTTIPEKHDLAGKRIIIIGAGLAGLAFACALDRFWPQGYSKPRVSIYERSSKTLDRKREGYTMSIKPEPGLEALKQLGLLEEALRNSTVGTHETKPLPTFWTKDWQSLLDMNMRVASEDSSTGIPSTGIRLVRHVLRDLLLDSVPKNTQINWTTTCDSARTLDSGGVQVELDDGSTEECDFLVAADGANSSVRSALLPDQRLDYAGAVCFMGTSRFPAGKPDLLKHKWGINISGQGVPFLTFPVDNSTLVWAFSYRSKQPRARVRGDEAVQCRREILDEVRERGNMFREPFGQVVEATDPLTLQIFSAMHKAPIEHVRELPRRSIAFIGDSNHPVSPFSGSGANMGLLDAVVLARHLSACTSVRAAIDRFDAESMPRSQKAVDRGRWTITLLHAKSFVFWLLRAFFAVVSSMLRIRE